MHDVQPALDEATKVGQGRLGLLALGAHAPGVVERQAVDVGEVVRVEESGEVFLGARHQARWYSVGRARGPVRLWYLETRQSRVRALDGTLLEAKVVKGLGRRNSQGKAMQPGHVHREEAPFRPLGEIAELLPQ